MAAVEAIESGRPAGSLASVGAERRAARERASRLRPPLYAGPLPRLVRRLVANGRLDLGATDAQGAFIAGVPASPGVVTARVRIILDLADAPRLASGEILVTRATAPAWTPLFSIAGGVIADVGSALSHASIVAREYGIPAVVGCGDATTRLGDGETVTLDGSAGLVRRA